MILEELADNLFHVNYGTQREMNTAFMRVQAHYDFAEFRGRSFTQGQFEAWYTANYPVARQKGRFTYSTDWNGVNVPSDALRPFYEGNFDPLSSEEQGLLAMFENRRHASYYLIGTYGASSPILPHEISHGMFHLIPEYRKQVVAALGKLDGTSKTRLVKLLTQLLYHPDVFEDEMHAYLLANIAEFRKLGISSSSMEAVHRELTGVFDRHYKPKNPARQIVH